MPEVDAGGCRISFDVEGPGGAPVVLLSHALGTTRDLWRPQLAALASTFRVVRYDTRGHGESASPPGEYTLDRLGRDAVAILDAVGAARAHVCGLSLGGLTAMWLGLNAPDRVDRLVLANTAARIGDREMWDTRIDQVRSSGLRSVADVAPARWFSQGFREREPDVVLAFQAMLCGISPDGYTAGAAVLRDADLRAWIDRIVAPTLVVVGAHDPVTTPADGEYLLERIAGARRLLLDAAHLSNVEAGEAFTSGVRAFLAA